MSEWFFISSPFSDTKEEASIRRDLEENIGHVFKTYTNIGIRQFRRENNRKEAEFFFFLRFYLFIRERERKGRSRVRGMSKLC